MHVAEDVQEMSSIKAVAGEVTLYRAVIARAFRDALYSPGTSVAKPSTEALTLQREAQEWLLVDTDDFVHVCQLALLEPDAVRHAARKAIGNLGAEAACMAA